jgi:anti-anti-sigma regulatory factor
MSAAATNQNLGRLGINVAKTADGDVLTLKGQLDDQATLSELLAQLGTHVTIDLGGVRFINSVGVREWIVFLGALVERGTKIVLRNCSEPMVHQMNMVVEAGAGAEIESFFAPFVCSGCGSEQSVAIQVAPIRDQLKARVVPPQPCPDCGDSMRFDDFPNRYLLFLD